MKRAADAISRCLEAKKMTQTQLAASLGEDVRLLNQQLHRRNDMKVERFIELLEHIGFRLEIVENDGIRKVRNDDLDALATAGQAVGLFWAEAGEEVRGAAISAENAVIQTFENKEECFFWLRGCRINGKD